MYINWMVFTWTIYICSKSGLLYNTRNMTSLVVNFDWLRWLITSTNKSSFCLSDSIKWWIPDKFHVRVLLPLGQHRSADDSDMEAFGSELEALVNDKEAIHKVGRQKRFGSNLAWLADLAAVLFLHRVYRPQYLLVGKGFCTKNGCISIWKRKQEQKKWILTIDAALVSYWRNTCV